MFAFSRGHAVTRRPLIIARDSVAARVAEALLTMLLVALFLATVSVARVFGQEPGAASGGATRPWHGVFRSGPLVLDPQGRLEADWKASSLPGADTGPELTGAQVGLEGQLGRQITFEISAELASATPWRDLRAEYTLSRALSVTGGQFKVPLGLDATRSAAERNFITRSHLAEAYTPGRQVGVTLESRLWRKRITLEAGAFRSQQQASDGVASGDPVATAGRMHVGRATVAPFAATRSVLKDLHVGLSASTAALTTGRSDLRLRNAAGTDLTPPTYWAQGTRTLAGADGSWRSGPWSASAEFLMASDERRGQGNGNEDLAPLRGTAWYAEATRVVTGEKKARTIQPRRSLRGGGPGAIELTARVERASLGVRGAPSGEAVSPRADRPAWSQVSALTLGLNWYPARGTRFQVNLTREALSGATARSLRGASTGLVGGVRLQLFL